jgi:glucokinase
VQPKCGASSVVCVDVGGQHISAVAPAFDESTDRIVIDESRILKCDLPGEAAAVTRALCDLVASVADPALMDTDALVVSVATPGPIDKPALTVRETPNAKVLNNFNIGEAIHTRFPAARALLSNDGNAHAAGVLNLPQAAGIQEAWAFALGTGVGAGFVTRGKLVEGYRGNAAEAGHWPMRRKKDSRLPLLPCGCGNLGCVESYLGAGNLMKYTADLLDGSAEIKDFADMPSVLRGQVLNIRPIFDAARKGDALGIYIYDVMMTALADLIETACKVSNPQAIFLCGGIANAGDFLLQGLRPKLVSPGIMSAEFDPEIKVVEAPETTGLLGLAYLAQG